MIPLADNDPILAQDILLLLRKAARLKPTAEVARLMVAAQAGDGDAMERLARMVEP